MAYTVVDKGSKYFNTILVSGDGTVSKSFTGAGFQPDLVWGKARDSAYNHFWYDSVRGAGAEKELRSSSTSAEGASDNETYGYISSFDSDGFSVTGGTNSSYFNQSAKLFVNWLWKANGAGVSNTAGTITSTVSANTTSGFSIVSYTGSNSNTTVGHGLGVTPSMYIVKNRTSSNTYAFATYHKSLGNGNFVYLASTDSAISAGYWNSTSPTSTVFSVQANNLQINQSGSDYISYCFAEVKGFSKAFSYTGNGSSDGTFVSLGFRPAWLLIKRTDSAGYDWLVYDNKRQVEFNVVDDFLKPNLSDAETTGNAGQSLDFLSNGIKFRGTGASSNASGGTYIGFAIAEQPFVSSKGIVANAR